MQEEEKKPQKEDKPKKKSIFRKILKVFMFIILGLIGLNLLLYILLSIPAVQQKVADFAVNQLKTTLKTEVSIEEVRLRLFNHVELKGIYIEDQQQDTLLYAGLLDASLSPWELIKNKKLAITSINLNDFLINVNQKDSISDFNFQFIIDAFSSTDTTAVVDTTKGSMVIVIEDLNLKNGRVNYDVLSDTVIPNMFDASHIALYDVNANLDLNSIDTEKLDIALNNLSAKEKSGVQINELKGHIYSEGSKYRVEGLSLTLPNSHLNTEKAMYDLNTQEFELLTNDTEIEPLDLVAFLPNLKFLEHKLLLQTDIKGKLPAVNVGNINLLYGEDFILTGNADIESYEDYGNSDINLNINNLKATPKAITSFAKLGDSTFVAPDILKDLGDIFLKGKVTGQLHKFDLDAEAWCRYGALTLLATGGTDTTFTNFNVTGGLQTRNFNLGRLLQQDSTGLGRLSAHINLRAVQTERIPLSANLKGVINAIQYNGATYNNIPLEAYYNSLKMGLSAKADLPIGKLMAEGDMTQSRVPDINFNVRVDTLHVDQFYKNEIWQRPRLTLSAKGNMKGLDIDNLNMHVVIDSLSLNADNFKFEPGVFTLDAGMRNDTAKFIDLKSSLIAASIEGKYAFSTITDEITNVMSSYLPAIFNETKLIRQYKNDFTYNITVYNTQELARIVVLPANILQPANISGRISTIEKIINLKGNVPELRYGDYDILNTSLNMVNLDSAFNITGSSKILMTEGNYRLGLKVDGKNNSVHTAVNIDSDSTAININGIVEAAAEFERNAAKELISSLKVIPSDIKVGKLALNLLPAEIMNQGERTEIQNFGIGVNQKRYFGADGVISKERSDSLKAYFDHANIGELLEAFDVKNIQGEINGDIILTNILEQPELYTSDFRINNIVIFADTLGNLNLDSEWSEDFGGARLNATLNRIDRTLVELDGTVYTNQDSLDLQLSMQQMPLSWMQPFVSDMLYKVDGSISTNLIIEGSTKAPKVRGFLGFNDTQLGIDYTNVTYTISDTISVSPDRIGFDNLTLRDMQGNAATVAATVTHKNFENMTYNLNMRMDKLMLLNTQHRTDSLFYGRMYASGNIDVKGNDNGINVNMQIRNDKNSTLNVLLPQRSEATEYKSVVYINVPAEKLAEEQKAQMATPPSASLPIKLNMKLDLTSDLQIGVIIDPSTGDSFYGKGSGSVNFTYDLATQNMAAYGDYTLNSGNVSLNLQGLKRLQFQIRDGSKLNFIGDPMRTRFNINAFHRVKRADLRTLDPSFGESNTRVDVDCELAISGNIDQMNLQYDVSLPNADDDAQRRVNSLISTDQQKITQFAYLLATGSFYSSASTGTAFNADGIWTSLASSTLSKGLTALFGNILGNSWQIGANVESSDGSFSDVDVSVDVSKQFWDGRLRVNTNLGYRNDVTTNENFIGDFDVEYLINSLWTLRAYTHTNDQYYRQAPTTQGIGIVYTKEAATLKRLFQSFRPRFRNRNQGEGQGQSQNQSQQSATKSAQTAEQEKTNEPSNTENTEVGGEQNK